MRARWKPTATISAATSPPSASAEHSSSRRPSPARCGKGRRRTAPSRRRPERAYREPSRSPTIRSVPAAPRSRTSATPGWSRRKSAIGDIIVLRTACCSARTATTALQRHRRNHRRGDQHLFDHRHPLQLQRRQRRVQRTGSDRRWRRHKRYPDRDRFQQPDQRRDPIHPRFAAAAGLSAPSFASHRGPHCGPFFIARNEGRNAGERTGSGGKPPGRAQGAPRSTTGLIEPVTGSSMRFSISTR